MGFWRVVLGIGVGVGVVRALGSVKNAFATQHVSRRFEFVSMESEKRGRLIKLREVCLKDAKRLFEIIDTERQRLSEYLVWVRKIRTLNDEVEFLQHYQKQRTNETGCQKIQKLIVVIEVDGEIAGTCSLTIETTRRISHIGYWIKSAFEGKGIVSHCTRYLKDFSLNRLCMVGVCVSIEKQNKKSRRVAERCGFSEVGSIEKWISPSCRRGTDFANCKDADLVSYAAFR
ncbi:hypothetical protein AAMO2058_001606800 [Amorphochlora amoebiformis]